MHGTAIKTVQSDLIAFVKVDDHQEAGFFPAQAFAGMGALR
jgi:hypothetical protein